MIDFCMYVFLGVSVFKESISSLTFSCDLNERRKNWELLHALASDCYFQVIVCITDAIARLERRNCHATDVRS